MLLALRFSLVLLLRRECLIQIDFREFVNQIRQHECVGIIGIEKGTALLREIGLVRFFIDREKELLLKLEQFFLARVLEEGKLGFIDGAALVRVFHHAQKLFVARLTEFHLNMRRPPVSTSPWANFSIASLATRLQSIFCFRTNCSMSGFHLSY